MLGWLTRLANNITAIFVDSNYLMVLSWISAGITEGFSMCAGDFVEVYSHPGQAGTEFEIDMRLCSAKNWDTYHTTKHFQ